MVDYYVKMKITNLSGKKILLIPGDNEPASGMPINANVIAVISKNVAVVEPNVPAVQFAVVDAETRKQFLLINGSQLITLRPVRNKNVMPINLVIGKPSKSEVTSGRLICEFQPGCLVIGSVGEYSTYQLQKVNFHSQFELTGLDHSALQAGLKISCKCNQISGFRPSLKRVTWACEITMTSMKTCYLILFFPMEF